MRLPETQHTSRPWRIHELAPEFRVEDVWRLPWRGRAEQFPELIEVIISQDLEQDSPGAVRMLIAIRNKLGALLKWDAPSKGLGSRVSTLRTRLPADLRDAPAPLFGALPFKSLYLLEDEFAAELANSTMHGVLHIGRVGDAAEGYGAQMAVLVKPNGWMGKAYMAAIKPFRYLIVYPALMRRWERAWLEHLSAPRAAPVDETVSSGS